MKLTKCKRCGAEGVYWTQTRYRKWILLTQKDEQHHCDDGKLTAVKCKYCNSDDLHWAEEINPYTQAKKMVLTESYGLPHACDERLAFIAKEKQDKKDKYEAEKKRIAAHPDGVCMQCKGTGYSADSVGYCSSCVGHRTFSETSRKRMLNSLRMKIWPHMYENLRHRGAW